MHIYAHVHVYTHTILASLYTQNLFLADKIIKTHTYTHIHYK